MSTLVAAPILIPMFSGALSLVFWASKRVQRGIAVAGTAALFGAGLALIGQVLDEGIVVAHAGGWPAPFGIVLVGDLLSAVLVALTGAIGFASALYSLPTIDAELERSGYFPLMHLLLAGVAGAFVTGDIFNLYVWFEVMLLASFALLAMGGERAQMVGALKYVVLNLIASALFLSAVGLLYGLAGTLNLADLAVKLAQPREPERLNVIATLFIVAFGIKAAAFPLFFWLPASYHTPPVAISALFAGLLTKVGAYSLYRVMSLVFAPQAEFLFEVIKWVALATMLSGALGALVQTEFRRVLSFQVIAAIGFILLGLGLNSPLGLAGGLFYLFQDMIVKAALFFIAGVVYRLGGTPRLSALGGLWERAPMVSLMFLLAALSLSGVPPTTGFWGKLMLVRAALEAGDALSATVVLGTGILILWSMLKVWIEVFWKAPPQPLPSRPAPLSMAGVAGLLAVASLLAGLYVAPIYTVSAGIARQLLDNGAYVQAVLGATAP